MKDVRLRYVKADYALLFLKKIFFLISTFYRRRKSCAKAGEAVGALPWGRKRWAPLWALLGTQLPEPSSALAAKMSSVPEIREERLVAF